MARNTLLINVADLRVFTDIGNNYNATSLSNSVLKAQDLELRDIVGKRLLDTYTNGVVNSVTHTGFYLTLLNDYINPYLIQASYFYLLQTIYITPRSNGLSKRTSSTSRTSLTQAEFNTKQTIIRSEMDFYGNKIKEYLLENRSEFSELSASTEVSSDAPDLENNNSASPLFTREDRRAQINPFR